MRSRRTPISDRTASSRAVFSAWARRCGGSRLRGWVWRLGAGRPIPSLQSPIPSSLQPPASILQNPVKVSILIPVYNEKPTLIAVLDRVIAAPLPDGCTREVIVINDGSTDGTGAALDAYARSHHSIVTVHSTINEGKGAALRAGIVRVSGDIVIVQDGDLEYDPKDYRALLQPIVDGHAAVVYGSRFRSSVAGMRWANWIANRALTMTANLLFNAGLSDEATGYKAFRADVL